MMQVAAVFSGARRTACAVVVRGSVLLLAAAMASAVGASDHYLSVEVSNAPNADFGTDGQRLAARDHRLEWALPAWRVGALSASAGVSYAYTRFEYADVASRDRDQHRLQIPLSLSGNAGTWRWRVQAAPGIATSSNVTKDLLDRSTSDDFFATGGALATRSHRAGTVAFGVSHDRRFGRSQGYPVFAWRGSSARLNWQLGVPDAWIDFTPRSGTTVSAGLGPAGMQWHTVRDDFASRFDYRVRRWDLRLELTQQMVGSSALSLHAGRAFDRRHQFGSDAIGTLDLDAADAWFFGLGIRLGGRHRPEGYAEAW